jgi:ankyrin repeat protein
MDINHYTFQCRHADKIFPIILYDRESVDPSVMPDTSTACAICWEKIFGSHSVAVLHVSKKLPSFNEYAKHAPGMHFFHADCLNQWWEEKKEDVYQLCPNCRHPIDLESYFSSVANAVASNQSPDVICKLIDDGADCNAFHSSNKMTAIHIATKNGNVNLINILLAKGADINIQDRDDNTALHYAIEIENLEILKILLKNNPNINIQGIGNQTALHMAAGKPKCPELFLEIMDHDPNLEIEDAEKLRAIHYAAESGHQMALEALIAKGVNVNAVNEDNRTALHYVNRFSFDFSHRKEKNQVELAKALISAGARLDILSGCGDTVFDDLNWSEKDRELARVMLPPLVENFEDVKKIFAEKKILYYAFLTKDKEIVKQLVAKGAKIRSVGELRCLGDEKQEFLDLLSNEDQLLENTNW